MSGRLSKLCVSTAVHRHKLRAIARLTSYASILAEPLAKLPLPVPKQRLRADDDRLLAAPLLVERPDKPDRLDRLAKAHLVRNDMMARDAPVQKPDALDLVRAQVPPDERVEQDKRVRVVKAVRVRVARVVQRPPDRRRRLCASALFRALRRPTPAAASGACSERRRGVCSRRSGKRSG